MELDELIELKNKINNELAVPLYRAYCKKSGLNFVFPDEQKNDKELVHGKLTEVLHHQMPLHRKSMSLFNFVNAPYHPFDGGLVGFAYTSWDDFSYKYLSPEQVADEMEKKDSELKELEHKSSVYEVLAFISTLILLAFFTLKADSWATSFLGIIALFIMFYSFYRMSNPTHRKKRAEWIEYEKRLESLKQELRNIELKTATKEKL